MDIHFWLLPEKWHSFKDGDISFLHLAIWPYEGFAGKVRGLQEEKRGNPFQLLANYANFAKTRGKRLAYPPLSLQPQTFQKELEFVDDMEFHMLDLDQCDVMRDTLESSDVAGGGAQLFLYQSGYLTIKHSDGFGYVIGFPNEEVRQALYNLVLPALTLRAGTETLKQ